jgi:hypothetical protein
VSESSSEPELRYKDVEGLLTRIFEVPPGEEGAFRARLRHLRNKGIPKQLPSPGSGAPIGYTRQHLMQMIIGLELSALGIAPRYAADLTEKALGLDSESSQGQPQFAQPSECEEGAVGYVISQFASGRMEASTEPATFVMSRPRFESIQDWDRLCQNLRGKRQLYLIIYHGIEFAPGYGYHIDIKEMTESNIAKEVSSNLRVSFVNLSSAFKMLDEYLKRGS